MSLLPTCKEILRCAVKGPYIVFLRGASGISVFVPRMCWNGASNKDFFPFALRSQCSNLYAALSVQVLVGGW